MTGSSPDQVLTDERLDSLERFRDVDFPNWQKDLERRFAEAFPGGDQVGHCRYHDLMIEDINARKRLRQAIVEKTVSGLVWGLIAGTVGLLWYGAVAYLKSLKGGG